LFLATVCPNISLYQQQQVGYLQPLTCHVVDYFNARPCIGNETETLIRVMVYTESDEESVRNPNDVSISPCAFKKVQGANSFRYIIIKEMSGSMPYETL